MNMAQAEQVTRHPEAERSGAVHRLAHRLVHRLVHRPLCVAARGTLALWLVCLMLAPGCTPHQQMRLGSMGGGLPIPPGSNARSTAANAGRVSASAANQRAEASEHGEKIDPFEIEKPPLDDEQIASVDAPSIDAPNNPDDPVESSKKSLAAEGSIAQTNLLDEDLSVETEHPRAIDAPMSELVRAPSGTGEARLADSAVKSVLLASHTEESDAAIAPGANDAGPPTPPWLKRGKAAGTPADNSPLAAARASESSRRTTAATKPDPHAPAPNGHPNEANGNDAFDPFEGTSFASDESDANEPDVSAQADASEAMNTDSNSDAEAEAESPPSATAIAARMMAQRAQKAAPRLAAQVQRSVETPRNAKAQRKAKTPGVNAQRTATGERDQSVAKAEATPYVGPPIPQELSASMGDTLLKYASFSETPSITPISIVYTPQMDVDAEVLAMEEAARGITPAAPAPTPPATKGGMKSQPAAAKKKSSRGNPVRTASRATPAKTNASTTSPRTPGARPAVSTGVETASLQMPAPTPQASTPQPQPAVETGLRDTSADTASGGEPAAKPTASNAPATEAASDAADASSGWQPVRREQPQSWKSKP